MRRLIDLSLLPESVRLYVCEQMEKQFGALERATARREARQQLLYQLDACSAQSPGYRSMPPAGTKAVAVLVWSRDCDCCESTNRYYIEATAQAYDDLYERIADGAEGPFSISIIPFWSAFSPTFRDRALEAYEDGHPHAIYA